MASEQISDYEPVTRSTRVRRRNAAVVARESLADSIPAESGAVLVEDRAPTPDPLHHAAVLRRDATLKRGHAVSYAGLFLFTAVLYFRPYEMFSALSSLTSLAFWIALPTLIVFLFTQVSLEGNLTFRPREVSLALLLVVTALLSMPLAASPAEAWEAFNKEFIKAVLMFIVIVNVVRTERRLKWMVLLALAVSFHLSVNALSDFRAGRFAFENYRITGSIGGMFGNPNDMALHLVTMIPLAVALLFSTRNPLAKLLYLGCVVLMVGGIVVTYSRGGFIGLVSVAVVLAWKLGRRNKIAVVAFAVISVALLLAFAPGNYITRIASIFDSSLDPNGSSTARSELLKLSMKIAIANPMFGIGMGNFHIVSIREAVTHNAFTQVAAEMGMTAAVLYTMFMIAPLRKLVGIERETYAQKKASPYYYLSVGIQVSIIGYMVGSFFASVAYLFYVYYLVGYAVCLRRLYEVHAGPLAARDSAVAATAGARGRG